jgi:hypothetical protein
MEKQTTPTRSMITSFLDKLIDWREFELFVADLYKTSDDLTVSHDVTETGKSGAKRQVDVMVIQKMKLHTIKTIIECKRWKDKVDRHIIDVMAASIKDLGANKGAIFTTKGYEEGAVQYAKSENIDIFVIRDINDDEWGQPGRHINFFMQYYNAKWDKISFGNARYFSASGKPPTKHANLAVTLSKDQVYPEHLDLYTADDKKGPNLIKLIINTRNHILNLWSQSFGLLEPADGNPQQQYEMNIKLDCATYPYKFFKHEDGYITFDSIDVVSKHTISQTKFEFDRASSSDLALVVENYITNQRNYASKSKDTGEVKLSDPIEPSTVPDEKVLKNGSVMKIILDYYVDMRLDPGIPLQKYPDTIVMLQAPPDQAPAS